MPRNAAPGDMRYSKDQLLQIFQSLKETSMIDHHLQEIFAGSWNPLDHQNGAGASSAAGDGKDQTPGPEVCWNYNVNPTPFGLAEMTEEEKQVRIILSFSSTLCGSTDPQMVAFLYVGQFAHQATAEYNKGKHRCRRDRWT